MGGEVCYTNIGKNGLVTQFGKVTQFVILYTPPHPHSTHMSNLMQK